MARQTTVHRIASTEADHTGCGIYLFGRSNGRAPICSTNREHVTCPDCNDGYAYGDPERFAGTPARAGRATTTELKLAKAEAERIYYSCGGHKLAARMEAAIRNIDDVLMERRINELHG